jgi:hypothetical protein
MTKKTGFLAASMLGLLLGIATPGIASPINVTLDTSAVSGGAFSLVFDLIDGDGIANNSVSLSGFAFGGGSVSGSAATIGGASGDLAASIALSDSSFFNEFLQGFTAGDVLSFTMDASANFGGGSPDSFTMVLLDSSGTPIASADPLGADAFLSFDLAPGSSIQSFASTSQQYAIPAPTVGSVPEPGTPMVLAGGLLGLLSLRWKR